MHPIRVCEVDRRIISKAFLFIIEGDIQEAVSANQLCGGQIADVEAAVHAVRQLFNSDDTEGILLVDASNAFNSLNRANALANISSQCPPFSTVLLSTYIGKVQISSLVKTPCCRKKAPPRGIPWQCPSMPSPPDPSLTA